VNVRPMARAIAVAVALCLLDFLYIRYIAWVVPGILALPINLVVVPLAIGVIAFRQFQTAPIPLLWLILMPALIPLPTTLLSGGDPAKPGLHWELYYVVVFILFIGEGMGYVATWLFKRKKVPDAKA
jgi:hypothetical protein